MKRKALLAMLLMGALATGSEGAKPYGANAALNPVRFQPPPSHEPLRLITEGRAAFAIAIDQASESTINQRRRRSIHRGAEVLRKAFGKCFGVEVPIVDAGEAGLAERYGYLILVGKSVLTDALEMRPLELPAEGFEVRSFAGGVAIAGHDGSIIPDAYHPMDSGLYRLNGTLNGVHDFIERFLGVRFYYPGDGTIWPEASELTLQPVHYQDWPTFQRRYSWAVQHSLTEKNWIPELGPFQPTDFEERWRLGQSTRMTSSHSPKPESWAKVHPDKIETIFYRAPNDHLYYNTKQHTGNYFDVTNLEVAKLLVDDLVKFYESGGTYTAPWDGWYPPNSEYVIFGQCDTFLATLDNAVVRELELIPASRRDSRDGALSDIYSRFHIALAEELKARLPDKRLAIMPYQNYALPPLKEEYSRFPDNVDLCVCIGDFPRSIRNPEAVARWRERLKQWYEVLGNRPVEQLWLYNAPNDTFGRAVIARMVAEIPGQMGEYLGRGGMYFDLHGGFDWEHYYNYYAMYRAMWNPEFNVDAALNEQWELMYGAAAPHLEAFDALLVERWESVRALGGKAEEAYPLTVLDELEKLLSQAQEAVVPESVEARRLALFSKPWPKAFERARGLVLHSKPHYLVKRIPEAILPAIDGKAEESFWQEAPLLALRDPFGGMEPPAFPTRARLAWSADSLYAIFEMTGAPKADEEKGLFTNDNVEIFLSPGMDGNDYFQIAVDATGQFWQGQQTLKPVATPVNADMRIAGFEQAISIGDDGWTLELRIPFAGLEVESPEVYSSWQVNIIRNKHSQPPEYTAFSLTLGVNKNVEYFGTIKFLGRGD